MSTRFLKACPTFMTRLRAVPLVLAFAIAPSAQVSSQVQTKRPVTSEDCVSVRDLQPDTETGRSGLKISPDGKRIAYLVRSPNLTTNQNEVELDTRAIESKPDDAGKPVLIGNISSIQWLGDSRHLLVLMRNQYGHLVIHHVDVLTGDRGLFFKTDKDISEYSVDGAAKTLVFAVDILDKDPSTSIDEHQVATGYRVPYQTSEEYVWPRRRLFVVRRSHSTWTNPKEIRVRSPLSHQPLDGLTHATNSSLQPSLSPDGKKLLLSYWDFSETMPDDWRASSFMKLRDSAGVIQAFKLLVLYDLATGETTMPLKTPWAHSAPTWLSGGGSFVVVSAAPISSPLEQEDSAKGNVGHSTAARAFWIDLQTGTVQQIASHVAYPWEGILGWDRSGGLLLRTSSLSTIERFVHSRSQWIPATSIEIPLEAGTELATDGRYVIGDFSDTNTPPELFIYEPGKGTSVQVFARLNPQFQSLTLGQPREVHWRTATGFDATGLLLLPPDYIEGRRYPLVIQTKPFGRFFVCGFGDFPSFAPQPIANAGIMYLGLISSTDSKQSEPETDQFPSGYPGYRGNGGIAEAAFQMDLWDSVVESLSSKGLVDRNAVGIVGFSRTGWYTEFILAHSKVPYRAATVADNVQYSLGEYWLAHDSDTMKQYEQMYGGPPYGDSLANWMKYSVSFNLDKIHTPVLMEEMGEGVHFDNPSLLPIGLAQSFEVFAGLNRLHDPVELYYYPNEGHEPEHPQARLATLERNVDWYRFWLQGQERPDPKDPNQYLRWHTLRKMLGPGNSAASHADSNNTSSDK